MRSASSSAWSSIKATSLATSTGTPFSPWTVASEATGRAWILARATLRRQRSIPVGSPERGRARFHSPRRRQTATHPHRSEMALSLHLDLITGMVISQRNRRDKATITISEEVPMTRQPRYAYAIAVLLGLLAAFAPANLPLESPSFVTAILIFNSHFRCCGATHRHHLAGWCLEMGVVDSRSRFATRHDRPDFL